MAVAGTNTICKEICDALGLKNVRRLQIKMEVDSLVTVEAEFFPEVNGVKAVYTIMREYELVPKKGLDGRRG